MLTVLWLALAYNAVTYVWFVRHEFLYWWHGVQRISVVTQNHRYGFQNCRCTMALGRGL